MSEDTLPPDDPANDTEPPLEDVEELAPIIPAGFAQAELSAALNALAEAFVKLEAVGMALARQLDGGAQ